MMFNFQFCLHVLVCLVGRLQAVQQLRSSNSILNSNFLNKKILEDEIIFTNASRASMCAYICTDTSTCLSFAYNNMTQTCVLFDKDFTDVNSTQTTAEDGWNYSYIVRDYEKKPNPCFAPEIDEICSLFCLHYFHLIPLYSEAYAKCQELDGGEMVRVDRGLKQYCMEKILVFPNTIRGRCPVYIQGRRNETTNKWTYDDGTEMTYFNWDTANGQPSLAVNETYVGIMIFSGFLWFDLFDDTWNFNTYNTTYYEYAHGTVCQQTQFIS